MRVYKISSFLVAILIITAFFAGVATEAAAAQTSPVTVAADPYSISVGQNASWGGVSAPYNYHSDYTWATTVVPKLSASSAGTTLTTSLAAAPKEDGYAYASLTVYFNIKGVSTLAQWNAIKMTRVTVITTRGYTLKGVGSTSDFRGWSSITVDGGTTRLGTVADLSTPGTFTSPAVAQPFITTLGALGVGIPGQCSISVDLSSSNFAGASKLTLSGNVNVPKIQFRWATKASLTAAASTAVVAVNKPFSIAGTLKTTAGTPIAGATIQLQKYVSGTWQNVARGTTTTTLTGAYRIGTSEPTLGAYQYRARYAGSATYANAASNTVKVAVNKNPTTITIATSPTTPTFNKPFTVSGTLKSGTTGLVGLRVHLEKRIGTEAWTDVIGTTKTTGTGGVIPSVSQTMTVHTTYSFRWHFTATATYQASYSPVKKFTV